jgi:hypothetical protein
MVSRDLQEAFMTVAWMFLLLIDGALGTKPITKDELVRRTQELADSVARGDTAPWRKYYADDAL